MSHISGAVSEEGMKVIRLCNALCLYVPSHSLWAYIPSTGSLEGTTFPPEIFFRQTHSSGITTITCGIIKLISAPGRHLEISIKY